MVITLALMPENVARSKVRQLPVPSRTKWRRHITVLSPPQVNGQHHSSGEETLVATFAVSIDLPSSSELDLDVVSQYFESLTSRPLSRTGNVSRVELLGPSKLTHYLLLVTVDIPAPLGIDREFSALLPEGSKMSVVDEFVSTHQWPELASA